MAASLFLHDQHKKLGATFEEHFGVLLPRFYVEQAKEYEELHHGAAFVDLSFRGRFELRGEKARLLLNNLTSTKLPEKGGCHVSFLNRMGRMIADAFLYCLAEDAYLLDVAPHAAADVFTYLQPQAQLVRCTLRDASSTHGLLSFNGELAEETVARFLGAELPQHDFEIAVVPYGNHTLLMARRKAAGRISYDLYIPLEGMKPAWQDLLDQGILPAGYEAFNAVRIETGWPWFGLDFDAAHLPLECGLDSTVSYDKGCYIGQEIMARMDSRNAAVPKRLMKLTTPAKPSPRAVLFKDGKRVGGLTDSVIFSPKYNQTVAFGFLQKDAYTEGTDVETEAKDRLMVRALQSE